MILRKNSISLFCQYFLGVDLDNYFTLLKKETFLVSPFSNLKLNHYVCSMITMFDSSPVFYRILWPSRPLTENTDILKRSNQMLVFAKFAFPVICRYQILADQTVYNMQFSPQ